MNEEIYFNNSLNIGKKNAGFHVGISGRIFRIKLNRSNYEEDLRRRERITFSVKTSTFSFNRLSN